jgi:hypothetical protein
MHSPAAEDSFTLVHASAFNLLSVAAIESGLLQSSSDEASDVGPLGQSVRPLNADKNKSLCSCGNAGNRAVVMTSRKLAEAKLLRCNGQSIRMTQSLMRPNASSPSDQSSFCCEDDRKPALTPLSWPQDAH